MRTVLGCLWLAGLVVRSGFRLRGRYWSWRKATALGSADPGLGLRERLGAIIDYARWLERMRAMSR